MRGRSVANFSSLVGIAQKCRTRLSRVDNREFNAIRNLGINVI